MINTAYKTFIYRFSVLCKEHTEKISRNILALHLSKFITIIATSENNKLVLKIVVIQKLILKI